MARGSKMLLAGLAGIAAGVAVGILFAPARGSKTRKRLKKEIRKLSEDQGIDLPGKIKSITSDCTSEDDEQLHKPDNFIK